MNFHHLIGIISLNKVEIIIFFELNLINLAKILIKKILQVDPKKRMTIESILKDPWITENSNDKNIPDLKERISEFNAKKKFKVILIIS